MRRSSMMACDVSWTLCREGAADPGLPYDYRLLLTGYLPGYLYKVGALDRRYPLGVLMAEGDITTRARATEPHDDFSRAIRTPPEP